MLKFTRKIKGWEITEKGQILFSEIETLAGALAIAKANGYLLTEFKDLSTKRAA